MLENTKTVPVMVEVFEGARGRLVGRVLEALKAGAMEGGDSRGNRTSALVVRGKEGVDIKVSDSRTPLKDLEKLE